MRLQSPRSQRSDSTHWARRAGDGSMFSLDGTGSGGISVLGNGNGVFVATVVVVVVPAAVFNSCRARGCSSKLRRWRIRVSTSRVAVDVTTMV